MNWHEYPAATEYAESGERMSIADKQLGRETTVRQAVGEVIISTIANGLEKDIVRYYFTRLFVLIGRHKSGSQSHPDY